MFENIKTLTELNKERARLYAEPNANIIEINNEYNAIRSKLTAEEVTGTFKKLKLTTFTPPEQETFNLLPYLGQSSEPNTIIIQAEGVYC